LNIFIEIIGYVGTAVVLASMLMTSMTRLRIINMCGSALSAVYALITGALPVVVLNVALITINTVQLIKERRSRLAAETIGKE
jgi:hypothetical protein